LIVVGLLITAMCLPMVIQGETMNGILVKQGRKELPVYINGNKVMFDFNPYGGTIKIHFN
jgi:hypothetical protein